MENFVKNPNQATLHRLLIAFLQPLERSVGRSHLPVAWFVRLYSRKPSGEFESLSHINHVLVRLIHAARLVTFKELGENPGEEERKKILGMVHTEYLFFLEEGKEEKKKKESKKKYLVPTMLLPLLQTSEIWLLSTRNQKL